MNLEQIKRKINNSTTNILKFLKSSRVAEKVYSIYRNDFKWKCIGNKRINKREKCISWKKKSKHTKKLRVYLQDNLKRKLNLVFKKSLILVIKVLRLSMILRENKPPQYHQINWIDFNQLLSIETKLMRYLES